MRSEIVLFCLYAVFLILVNFSNSRFYLCLIYYYSILTLLDYLRISCCLIIQFNFHWDSNILNVYSSLYYLYLWWDLIRDLKSLTVEVLLTHQCFLIGYDQGLAFEVFCNSIIGRVGWYYWFYCGLILGKLVGWILLRICFLCYYSLILYIIA